MKNIKKFSFAIILLVILLSFSKFIASEFFENKNSIYKSYVDLTKDPSLQMLKNDSSINAYSYNEAEGHAVNIEQVIEDYLVWSEYPPDSRPLSESHTDILNPIQIPVTNQSLPIVENGKVIDSGYSCIFQPEHHTVTESLTMRVFLSCNRTGKIEKERIKLVSSELVGKAGNQSIFPPSIDGNDSGNEGDSKAGDLIYTYRFIPRFTDWGDFYLTTKFQISSDPKNQIHTLTHHFFSSPVAPAKFTGKFDDYIKDGSLSIDFELNVVEKGRYTIEANLLTNDDEPIVYARKDQKLEIGKQKVTLLFFGKAIVKRRESGPYKITFLRGELNTDVIQEDLLLKSPSEVDRILKSIHDDRPKKKIIPYYTGSIETKSYSLSEFSEKSYDSEEKRNRLSELNLIKDKMVP
ncbi:hypothetical protein LPTSP2_30580 [Leptospira ellinghausenii]|uniref:DUF4785 domain-containing protein n=2 Tax=Leptospira ellinghausenii TaxID=1917822 RepID=A0A2P2DGI8_9LEPT|nr:hypothetical protein LPTSP2_30580 [Leptospira ellinghausenii]